MFATEPKGVNEEIANVTTENPEVLAHLITVAEEAHQTHDDEAIQMLEQAKNYLKGLLFRYYRYWGAGKSSLNG